MNRMLRQVAAFAALSCAVAAHTQHQHRTSVTETDAYGLQLLRLASAVSAADWSSRLSENVSQPTGGEFTVYENGTTKELYLASRPALNGLASMPRLDTLANIAASRPLISFRSSTKTFRHVVAGLNRSATSGGEKPAQHAEEIYELWWLVGELFAEYGVVSQTLQESSGSCPNFRPAFSPTGAAEYNLRDNTPTLQYVPLSLPTFELFTWADMPNSTLACNSSVLSTNIATRTSGDDDVQPVATEKCAGLHAVPGAVERRDAVNCTRSVENRKYLAYELFSSLAESRAARWRGDAVAARAAISTAARLGMTRQDGGATLASDSACQVMAALLEAQLTSSSLSSPLHGPGVWTYAYGPALLSRFAVEAGHMAAPTLPGMREALQGLGPCRGGASLARLMWDAMKATEAGDAATAYAMSRRAHELTSALLGAHHPATLGALYAAACSASWAGNSTAALIMHRAVRHGVEAVLANVSVPCGDGAQGSGLQRPCAESHPLVLLSMLSSAEALAASAQLSRAWRYTERAVQRSAFLAPGHPVRALAAGRSAILQDQLTAARAGEGCNGTKEQAVCHERAAQLAANASWPLYVAAAQEWSSVLPASREASAEHDAFQRARAMAAFRLTAGPRMSWLEAGVLYSISNRTGAWDAAWDGATEAGLPLGHAVAWAAARALSFEGHHSQAVQAFEAVYGQARADHDKCTGALCGHDAGVMAAAAAAAGREQALAAWHAAVADASSSKDSRDKATSLAPLSSVLESSQDVSLGAASAAGLTYVPWSVPELVPWYKRTGKAGPAPLPVPSGAINVIQGTQDEGPSAMSRAMRTVRMWLGLGQADATGHTSEGSGPKGGRPSPSPFKAPVRRRRGPSSSPTASASSSLSPSPSTTGLSPAAGLDLTSRLSEYFLRHGMAVFGCKLVDTGATRAPGGKPQLQSFPPVKCESQPHPLAPPALADLYNPAGFEDPARADMLTARGMAYLQSLLRDVAALEAQGQAWELVVARTPEDIVGRPYAAVGLLVPALLQPGKQPASLPPSGHGVVAAPSLLPSVRSAGPRDLSHVDVMGGLMTLLGTVQGVLPPIRMEGGTITNRREMAEWFIKHTGADPSGWSNEKVAAWVLEAAARAAAQGAKGQLLSTPAPSVTLGPGPWAPELLGHMA